MPRMYRSVLDTKKSLNEGSLPSFVDAFPIENRTFKLITFGSWLYHEPRFCTFYSAVGVFSGRVILLLQGV